MSGTFRLGKFRVGKFGFGDLATSDSWLSSVKDQNQGTRNDKQPHLAMRPPPTVLFHPDFNRRLRNHTESADPFSLVPPDRVPQRNKALAGLGCLTLTAGGDFHPALRTSAARLGNLPEIMTKPRRGSKVLWHGDLACPHVPTASLACPGRASAARARFGCPESSRSARRNIGCPKVNDCGDR